MVQFKHLSEAEYNEVWQAMQAFTQNRQPHTPDEIWLLQHPPVFTLGQAGKIHHVLDKGDIPLVQSDRGGQVTYHGPGQLIAYVLCDLKRRGLGVRQLVSLLEESVIQTLAQFSIHGQSRADAPGVYVGQAKIASLGLRIRRGASYHGLALNVAMDLSPFQRINPCGFPGLAVTQMADWGPVTMAEVEESLSRRLLEQLEAYGERHCEERSDVAIQAEVIS